MRMKIYQTPQIEIFNLNTQNIGRNVLCTSASAKTEGFYEYDMIMDEE